MRSDQLHPELSKVRKTFFNLLSEIKNRQKRIFNINVINAVHKDVLGHRYKCANHGRTPSYHFGKCNFI